MFNLQQRSSIASSIVTSLIGWVGMVVMFHLLLGQQFNVLPAMAVTLLCAFIQLIFLKVFFFKLNLHKNVKAGALWGALTSAAIFFACYLTNTFVTNSWVWLPVLIGTGAAVGSFLSYFFIDDQQIHFAQSFRSHINYGRDALWLVPFAYGAGAYLVAFLPTLSATAVLSAVVSGAMVGVAAAGLSHYTNDHWKFNPLLLLLLILIPGSAFGLLSGLLFRNFELQFSPWLYSTAGGLLTFAITFIKGRQLARREMEGRL